MKTIINLTILLFVLTLPRCQDAAVSDEIAIQLEQLPELNFPLTLKRFYKENDFQSIWVQSAQKPAKTWSSMLLLDCVLQYGLSHDEYHPDKLLHSQLRTILKYDHSITAKESAIFELYLTDALLTFINDLHFGRANPVFPRSAIDEGNTVGFSAETILRNALNAKDFMSVILDVQPKSSTYINLQKYMVLIRGQYLDDCYTVPDAEVRKVAINMERCKWNTVTAKSYVEVNIPSYTLTFHAPDTSFTFNIAVGRKERPTPELQSAITYIGTAPDWKVPHNIFVNEVLPKALKDVGFLEAAHYTIYNKDGRLVMANAAMLNKISKDPTGFSARQSSSCELTLGRMAFHFTNKSDIYLYDGQQKQVFLQKDRAQTNGCISLEQADSLAIVMLNYDGQSDLVGEMLRAANAYQSKNFIFKKPLPLVINYQTCSIKNGLLVTFADPYNKDSELEKNIYRHDVMLAKK